VVVLPLPRNPVIRFVCVMFNPYSARRLLIPWGFPSGHSSNMRNKMPLQQDKIQLVKAL
jgi:hypothetical protein